MLESTDSPAILGESFAPFSPSENTIFIGPFSLSKNIFYICLFLFVLYLFLKILLAPASSRPFEGIKILSSAFNSTVLPSGIRLEESEVVVGGWICLCLLQLVSNLIIILYQASMD